MLVAYTLCGRPCIPGCGRCVLLKVVQSNRGIIMDPAQELFAALRNESGSAMLVIGEGGDAGHQP
jgi:hypothetical protein